MSSNDMSSNDMSVAKAAPALYLAQALAVIRHSQALYTIGYGIVMTGVRHAM